MKLHPNFWIQWRILVNDSTKTIWNEILGWGTYQKNMFFLWFDFILRVPEFWKTHPNFCNFRMLSDFTDQLICGTNWPLWKLVQRSKIILTCLIYLQVVIQSNSLWLYVVPNNSVQYTLIFFLELLSKILNFIQKLGWIFKIQAL